VGHDEIGFEAGARQPSADHRDRADGVGEDLAVAAEALRDRDDAHLGARRWTVEQVAHRSRTLRWYSASSMSIQSRLNSAQASADFALAAYTRWKPSSRS